MTEKQKFIDKMIKLGYSIDERQDMWDFDHDLTDSDEREQLTAKAKEITHYEKSDKPRKKSEPKERKIDLDKKYLHTLLMLALDKDKTENAMPYQQIIGKNEAEISFTFNGSDYTIKLTKHRKK